MACPSGCTSIIDSYDGSADIYTDIYSSNYYIGQAFTMGISSKNICCAKFYLKGYGSSNFCNMEIRIYSCSGTPGANGTPNSILTTGELKTIYQSQSLDWVEFEFTTPYELQASTNYCIVLYCTMKSGDGGILPYADNTSPSHSGNYCDHLGADSGKDALFYMYSSGWSGKINGITPAKVNLITIANIAKINGI